MRHPQDERSRDVRVARRVRSRAIALAGIAALLARTPLVAQTGVPVSREDREAVRRAVLDYVEGFYEGDSAKLARSVRPEIFKYGFWRPRDSTSYAGEQMAYAEFFEYAHRVKQNNHPAPATAPKTIELFDVQNQTASAKLTAFWGTDYLLLGKYNGKWMISSVMWQSPPRPAPPAGGSPDRGGGGAAAGGDENVVEPFANDRLATDNVYRGTFAPDGRTFFFFRKVSSAPNDQDYRILESHLEQGGWSAPARVSLGGDYSDLYPTISPDGRRMVFASYRPAPGDTSSHRNAHLWYADRVGNGWGPPVFMGKPNFLGHYNHAPLFLSDGSVYYEVLSPDYRTQKNYITRWDGRAYSAPESFDPLERWRGWRADRSIWNARLAPDRSFAILEISELANGRRAPADLYVSHRRGNDWTEPQPLRGGVNTGATENFAVVSPDGQYLYFVRDFAGFYRAPLAKVMPADR